MSAEPLTLEQACEMLSMAFNEPLAGIEPGRTRESILGWDSMGALMLIAELDDRFGVELTADDSRKMASIADVLQYLRSRQLLRE